MKKTIISFMAAIASLSAFADTTINYTFVGVEGITIRHGSRGAVYAEGVYTLADLDPSTLNYSPIELSVAPGYENDFTLVSVAGMGQTFTPAGASGVIYIPASQLPAESTRFTINVSEISDPSQTTRHLTLRVDDITAFQYWMYQGAGATYQGFGQEGSAELIISPQQFVVEVVTVDGKEIQSITTDAEGTFRIPELPASRVALNLINCIEGQTITLATTLPGPSGIDAFPEETGDESVYTLQGIRVDSTSLTPGIYIRDGRLLIVR